MTNEDFNEDSLQNYNHRRRDAVLDMAYEIISMQNEIDTKEAELKQLRGYKEKYQNLVTQNIKDAEEMAGTTLKLILDGGFNHLVKASPVPEEEENHNYSERL